MATIPLWMLGKHIASVTIYPQTVGTSGILADASTKGITSQIDHININATPTKENINAVGAPRANHVIVEDDWSMDLGLIEVHNASDPNPVMTGVMTPLGGGSEVFKFIFVRGTQAGSIETWTGWGTRGPSNSGINGKGKQVSNFVIDAADTGSTTYLTRVVS